MQKKLINLSEVATFAANMQHAVRNNQVIDIGGGAFNAAELQSPALALKAFEPMAYALKEISEMLSQHPDFSTGNSKVHYCAHKALGALPEIKA